jgi:hypothetical protein
MTDDANFSHGKSDAGLCSRQHDAAGPDETEELLVLARMLREMPDREPPKDLAEAVMRSLKPKQISPWRRLYLWAATPRSISLSPLKLLPAGVAISIALFLTIHFFPKQESPLRVTGNEQRLVAVTFTFHYPEAQSVNLVGSFNQWNPIGFHMSPRGEERVWVLNLKLPPGRYEYAFLVDGKVVLPDPRSPFSESDGFGSRNSILFVSNGYDGKKI